MEEVSVLIQKAQAGDSCARDILIEKNLGLVHHIVKRFAGRGYDPEDLFQTGTIGLMKAIDHFDLRYDVKFSTYAVPLIAGEIRRFLRDDGMVKVSRTLKEIAARLKQAGLQYQTEQGREPSLRELCEKAGVSYEDAVMAIGASGEVESIEKTIYEGDGRQIRLLDKGITLKRSEAFGKYFSLFPMELPVDALTITGAKYPLKNHFLRPDDSLCVSNEFEEDEVTISFSFGKVILMETRD